MACTIKTVFLAHPLIASMNMMQSVGLKDRLRRKSRSILRRIAHRLGYATLQPISQLAPVSDGHGSWMSTGTDPQFLCEGLRYPLRQGWYHVTVDMAAVDTIELDAKVYIDFGMGMNEAWSQRLALTKTTDGRHSGVVLMARGANQLRLDPATMPGKFRVSHFRVHPIFRAQAAWIMLTELLRRQSGYRQGMLLILRAVRRAMSMPHSSFAIWLRHLYDGAKSQTTAYQQWTQLYDRRATPSERGDDKNDQVSNPHISVLVPVFNTPEKWLRKCLDSVLDQTYPHWELCIADDASTLPHIVKILAEYESRDHRIKVVSRANNGHISAASNSALSLATGDFVALLDHDDELHPDALLEVSQAIAKNPTWQLIYSDEDKINEAGLRFDPYFKPDWNLELLRGQNCVSHLGVFKTTLMREIGGFRVGLEGSQDWDLALRCAEKLNSSQIGHIARILYHWRAITGSTALGAQEKGYAHDAARRALSEHFSRSGESAQVLDLAAARGLFQIQYALPLQPPKVSLVIPTRDHVDLLRQCVTSILARTSYPNYELIIVDNQSTEPETLRYFQSLSSEPRVRVLSHNFPFNYSRLNNAAVTECEGDIVGLVNNDIEVISPNWLTEMVSHACRPHVGVVGAMLYYPDGTIQHAGVITGIHGVAGHPYCHMPRGYGGQMGRARLAQRLTCVTGACMVLRRGLYNTVGGLDEALSVAFNDVDMCLRIHDLGFENIWTPFAELYHHESATRGSEDTLEKKKRFQREVAFMQERWQGRLENDSYYNPNLSLTGEPFSLAFPPRW